MRYGHSPPYGNAEGLTTATWPARQPTGGPPALKHAFQGREPLKAWTAADLERSIADVARRSLLLPTWEPTPSLFSHSSPRPRAYQQRGARVQEGRPEASEQRSGFALLLSSVPPSEDSANPPMTPVNLGEATSQVVTSCETWKAGDAPRQRPSDSPPDPRTSDRAARKADRRGVKGDGPSRGRSAPHQETAP